MKALKVIGCAGVLLLAGCVDNYVSIEVLGAKPFELDFVEIDDEVMVMCAVPSPGDELQLPQGWIDFEDDFYTYVQPFEVRNNLPRNDTDVGRLNTNNFTLERMVVEYSGLPGRDSVTNALDGFETVVNFTGVISSDGGSVVLPLTLMPDFRGRAIQTAVVPSSGSTETIIAKFYLEGHTNAGRSISTGTIEFPITIGFQSGICDDGRCDCYRQ